MSSTSGDLASKSANTASGSANAIARVLSALDEQARPGVLDCRATLERLDGDLELFRDLLGFYFRDTPMLTEELGRAVRTGDADAMRRWAHRLKGLVSNFDARYATQAALELEQMGISGELAGAPTLFRRLEAELRELSIQLQQF